MATNWQVMVFDCIPDRLNLRHLRSGGGQIEEEYIDGFQRRNGLLNLLAGMHRIVIQHEPCGYLPLPALGMNFGTSGCAPDKAEEAVTVDGTYLFGRKTVFR